MKKVTFSSYQENEFILRRYLLKSPSVFGALPQGLFSPQKNLVCPRHRSHRGFSPWARLDFRLVAPSGGGVGFWAPFSEKMLQNRCISHGFGAGEGALLRSSGPSGPTGSSGSSGNDARLALQTLGSPRLRSG